LDPHAECQLLLIVSTINCVATLKASTSLIEIDMCRNEFSGIGIRMLADAIASTGAGVQKLKLNDQKHSVGSEAELAMVAAAKANPHLKTLNMDWKSSNNRHDAEKHLVHNTDQVRMRRTSSVQNHTIAPTVTTAIRPPSSTTTPSSIAGPDPSDRKARLLIWCQELVAGGSSVHISNFHSSFGDGMAFCAIMHGLFPHKSPMATLSRENRKTYVLDRSLLPLLVPPPAYLKLLQACDQ
jgi:hypothetical protein